MRFAIFPLLVLFASLNWTEDAVADENCNHKQGARLVSLQGKVFFDSEGHGQWQPAQLDQFICEGSRVSVETYSRASLALSNGVVLRLDAGTVLSLNAISPSASTLLDLAKGFIHFISRTPKHLEITSPIANAGPEGTEFAMHVNGAVASLWVYEGGVRFFNQQGSVRLKPGQGAQALSGQAPRAQIDVTPQDAVNWALYYPPILPYPDASATITSELRTAMDEFRRGRVDDALFRFDALPPEQHTAYFFKVRGAMRLTAGRVALADEDIRALLTNNPNDADALALQSVQALTQNCKDDAYHLANEAVAANPQSASAYSALSYAEQSRFALDKAQQAADQAAQLAPHDAMVWARKAELELAQGLTSDSRDSTKHAAAIDPNLERTQTVSGFAYLLQMDTDDALRAFEKAIRIDSTSPLARIGLGLAKIRKGDLEAGRQDLEIAAILDPENALIRSYLGKAYYEENRNALAQDQFDLAKQRDPKDPTSYFYDALKKQTENRPVEALHDLQKAIALNDNRAIYRSKQFLDNDLAIRNTSLARIYDDLGFDSRATVEATKSLTTDPSNYSAHRFLSDAYVRLPRREIAQVSELLQSQLMQPLNSSPVQPHLSVKGLSAISGLGPVEPSFKDFTSAFQRNKPQLTTSGVVGSDNTYGDEVVLSGIHDAFAYSLGQYHFQTDGFRKDANVTHNLYNAFLQTALTPDINLQFEFRKRQTAQGDRRMLLSHDTFVPTDKRNLDQTNGRVGVNFTLSPKSHLLGSFIYTDSKENLKALESPTEQNISDYRKGFEAELQFLHDGEMIDTILGAGTYLIDTKKNTLTITPATTTSIAIDNQATCEEYGFTFVNGKCVSINSEKVEKNNDLISTKSYSFYNYNNVTFPNNVKWTIGFSYEQFNGVNDSTEAIYHRRIFPKFGMQWFITDWLRLRGVFLKTLKRQLVADQTIEPTQVAGFNQFYDDFNGDQTTLKGVGVDVKISSKAYTGIEINERNIHADTSAGLERQIRYYLNWTLAKSWAFSIEDKFERYSRSTVDLETNLLPLTIKFFDDSGFFAQMASTWVWQQKQERKKISTNFALFDFSIGYRLSKRVGIISLEAQNITDEKFIYQDDYDRTSDKFNVVIPFLPTRTIMLRAILNF